MRYKAFHKLLYGLYIIASQFENKKAGYIGNTAFQITSSPAQIAISCHKNNATADIISKSKVFSISILKKESETSLIGEFGFMSSADIDKFRNIEIITAKSGAPIVINSTIAWFDCQVVNSVDIGSHILFIGEVLDAEVISEDKPLTYDYYREKYKMLSPKNAPTFVESEKLESETDIENEVQEDSVSESAIESKKELSTHTCTICGFQYNPEEGDPTLGIPPGTPFEDLPDDYKCPICGVGKEFFTKN